MYTFPNIKLGDIVQILEGHEWEYCLIIVSKIKNWGIEGYIDIPNTGQAYTRLKWDEFQKVGEAHSFIVEEGGVVICQEK